MTFIKFNEFRIILLFAIEYIVIPSSLLKGSLFVTEITQLCNDLQWDIKIQNHTSIQMSYCENEAFANF